MYCDLILKPSASTLFVGTDDGAENLKNMILYLPLIFCFLGKANQRRANQKTLHDSS